MSVSIKPLEDRIVVLPVEAEQVTASGLVIPDTAKEKPQEAEVVAVGPGRFSDEGDRARYQRFTYELRCPKCQNQNLADSNAPIATDLRREIYRMFAEGKSNAEIVEFLVDRYGDFVLYNPPLSSKTAR